VDVEGIFEIHFQKENGELKDRYRDCGEAKPA
jgi:hypothetical protein